MRYREFKEVNEILADGTAVKTITFSDVSISEKEFDERIKGSKGFSMMTIPINIKNEQTKNYPKAE